MMPAQETMVSSTRRYLRGCREWLPGNHPLAVALGRTAHALDLRYQASVMSQYTKLIEQIERKRPAAGQGMLPTAPAAPGLHLIGPRVS